MKRLLWLTGLIVGSNALVAAQNPKEMPKGESNSTPKIEISFEVRGAYDFNKYYTTPGFSAATIPMKSDADNKKRFLFDIPNAKLCIEKELAFSQGEVIKLVLKTNLKEALALDSVYADYKGFRVGKVKTNFCDPDACGLAGGSFVQVRWKDKLHPLISYAVAIEKAPDFVIYPEVEKKEERDEKMLQPYNELPRLTANVRYEEENSWHVQLSGLLGFLEYRNKKNKKDTYLPTWGINLGATYHLVPEQTTLKLQGIYGQGIGSYMADLEDLEKEVNTVYTTGDESSARKTLDAWGAGIGVEHKWLPKLRSEAAYHVVSTVDSERDGGAYKWGHTISLDLFYHPIEQFKIGAQYLLGIRQNISKDRKDANRIQAVIGFEI